MRGIFGDIQRAGLDRLSDPLAYRRVLFINNLSLACSMLCVLITILLVFEALYPQNVMVASAAGLFLVPPFLNRLGKHFAASTYYISFSTILIIAVSLIAYRQFRFNELENVLIAFMIAAYFLFDGKLRYVGYVLIFFVLVALKFLRQHYAGGSFDFNFYLVLQNLATLCFLLFLFVDIFRSSIFQSMEKLHSKEQELFSMIDNIPLFIGLIDREMRYLMVNINYQKAFGIDRNEIIGSRIDDVLPPNILEIHKPMVQAALAGESPDFIEHTAMPDGKTFYASGKYVPIFDEQKRVIAVSVFVSDVSKLEEAKNALAEANQTKDRLFSIIAHDIRGPLDMFQTLLSVSSEGSLTQEQFMIHQNTVKEKLDGLRSTVDTLLDWARTQLDGIQVSPKVVVVGEVLAENRELFQQLLHQKSITFDIRVDDHLQVWIDKNHFKIIIRNLLHNAIKFSPSGGTITVSSEKEGNHAIICIKDQGQGMEQEQIDSILAMQVQQSKSGTAGEGGIGLGLSLSMGLLDKNRCKAEIISKAGSGTEIRLKIPAAD